MLNTPKADKASLLSEAVNRLTVLTRKCHTLESELAVLQGSAPPEQPFILAQMESSQMSPGSGETEMEGEGEDEMDTSHARDAQYNSQPGAPWASGAGPSGAGGRMRQHPAGPFPMQPQHPQQRPPLQHLSHPAQQIMRGPGQQHPSAAPGMRPQQAPPGMMQHAHAAAAQLQQWAQLGESSFTEVLQKDQQTTWNYVCTRDGVQGFSASLPIPAEVTADGNATQVPTPPEPERLDYCVKSETTIEMEPAQLSAIYMNVDERQKWHSACQDSRLVEDIWPNTMRIAIFTYRTELPVFPRGYCALIHRASHRLPDGRTQIVVTDRSVSHPSMPASRHFIFMTVYPSGMLITPVRHGNRTFSHVKLISHFHLRGTIAQSILGRIKTNRMIEACCFNYLHEFRSYVLTHYAPSGGMQPAPALPMAQPPPPQQQQQQEQYEQAHEQEQPQQQPQQQPLQPQPHEQERSPGACFANASPARARP